MSTPTPPQAPQNPAPRRSRKLHRRYVPLVFSFYMAGIMAFLMCATIVGFNTGLGAGFWGRVFHAYVVAMPVAFCCVLLVRPVVLWLVGKTVDVHSP